MRRFKEIREKLKGSKIFLEECRNGFNILVNELHRRFEVLDEKTEIEEKVKIIDHFIQQLCNSDYSLEQIKLIVESSLKGIEDIERGRRL